MIWVFGFICPDEGGDGDGGGDDPSNFPEICIIQPIDQEVVPAGVITIMAEVTFHEDIDSVTFYINEVFMGKHYANDGDIYYGSWDASGEESGSFHFIKAKAHNVAQFYRTSAG